MAESAAHLVDQVIPRVPIPLRILFAAHPELLTPVLRIIHRVIAGFLRKQACLNQRGQPRIKIEAPHAAEEPFLYRITCRGAEIWFGNGHSSRE